METATNQKIVGQTGESLTTQDVTGGLLSLLPYFIILTDSNGKIIFANEAAVTVFGYDGATIPQKNIFELIPSFQESQQYSRLLTALDKIGRWHGEILVPMADSQQSLLEITAIKIFGPAPITLYTGQDITAQKCQDRGTSQAEKHSLRGEMAGEISHELNNYLSIIMGNLELLGMGIAKGNIDSLAPRIKSMRDGLTRITKFVEGLMSIARPDSVYETFNLRQFVESEVFYLKNDPRFKGIEFIYEWDDKVSQIDAVRGRLQQAIINICSNACDALTSIPDGQKKIIFKAIYSSEDDFVNLNIIDNGCGMSDDDYPKLFRQLFTTKGAGHGFGLLTIKGAIKSQGGRVSAAPAPGGGACFTIALPRVSAVIQSRTAKVPA
jgi:PAS domain S-box-containing protein